MSTFPNLTGAALPRALQRAGFKVIRTRGSHHVLRHEDGRTVVVPVHAAESIGPGLLGRILRDCDLSRDALRDLL